MAKVERKSIKVFKRTYDDLVKRLRGLDTFDDLIKRLLRPPAMISWSLTKGRT